MSIDTGRDLGLKLPEDFSKETFEKNTYFLEVPAVPGKEKVKILPKAVYFHANHDQYLVDYPKDADWPTHTKTKDAYYAAYAFMTDGGQTRFITIPVALLPDNHEYNQALLADMSEQGLDIREIQRNCDLVDVESVFDPLIVNALPDLRQIMKEKAFVDRGYHSRDGGNLESGWRPNPGSETLTIIGQARDMGMAKMNPFVFESAYEQYPTGVNVISKPLHIKTANGFEKEMYARALKLNQTPGK